MFAQRRRKQPKRQNARCGDHYETSGVQLETPARNFTVPPPVGRICPPHHPKHLPQRPIHRGAGLVGTRITCDIIGRRRSFSTECHTFSGVELPPGGRTAQNLLALLSVVELFSLNLFGIPRSKYKSRTNNLQYGFLLSPSLSLFFAQQR